MNRAVVTGAGGFIGGALTKKLLETGVEVYGVTTSAQRVSGFSRYGDFHPIIADSANYNTLAGLLPQNADVFFHLAWEGIVSRTNYASADVQRRNFLMATHAAEAAVAANCKKFVFVGSSHEYLMGINSVDGKEINGNIYGVSKKCSRLFCEILCKDKIMFNSTVFTNIFGVGDYSRRTTNMFLKKMLKSEPISLVEGNNLYDWVYVDDAVEGLIAAGFKGQSGKQYYIGSRILPTFKEIITRVRDIVNLNAELLFGEYKDDTYIDYGGLDLDDLYNDTGFECKCDFRESVLKTAEWVKTLSWE